jgi:glutamate dehydrogenase (NAD(P)+)
MEIEKSFPKSMERFICSKEPENRSARLLRDSAKRLGISPQDLEQIEKPYTFFYQRLPVEVEGLIINISAGIVLHNRARGPYKGGIRIAHDVNIWETTELARLMTLKTALADLELGGGKSGIRVDFDKIYARVKDKLKIPYFQFVDMLKDHIMKEFVDHFVERNLQGVYIPAPDMGTSSREMMLFYNRTHDPSVVTAKPQGIEGWLPGRREATGFGTAYSTLKYLELIGKSPSKMTVSIQGFGNVGSFTAKYLYEAGCKVIGVTDLYGGVYDKGGIDIPALMRYTEEHRTVRDFDKKRTLDNEALFKLPVDILIPAASGNVIDEKNVDTLGVRFLVAEAANMPVTFKAFRKLRQKGVELLPDNYVNSGGVIASYLEYRQSLGGPLYEEKDVFAFLRARFDKMFGEMLERRDKSGSFTQAACDIAVERIYRAMKTRSLL